MYSFYYSKSLLCKKRAIANLFLRVQLMAEFPLNPKL